MQVYGSHAGAKTSFSMLKDLKEGDQTSADPLAYSAPGLSDLFAYSTKIVELAHQIL